MKNIELQEVGRNQTMRIQDGRHYLHLAQWRHVGIDNQITKSLKMFSLFINF